MGFFDFLYEKKPKAPKSSVRSCPFSAPYVILDVETTGLSPYHDKIIQLSAIRYDTNGYPIACYDTYLNPGCPIPASASRVNHITDSMVSTAPAAEDIQSAFLPFIGNDLIVGYNVLFDLRFLANTFKGAFDGRKYVDVLSIVRNELFLTNYRLETVSGCLGFRPDRNFHNSLSDCEAVAAILQNLGNQFEEWTRVFIPAEPKPDYQKMHHKVEITPPVFTDNEYQKIQSHPLFKKNIVFTGTLRMTRDEAAQMAANCGAVIKSAVSGKTDYLVVGQQDCNLVGDDGMSTKEEKAFLLNQQGKAKIKVICENEFLSLLYSTQEIES